MEKNREAELELRKKESDNRLLRIYGNYFGDGF
jgi:hypothetical protein